ncbi:unnamed protein product [Schistocephalus solidus]|uniref:Cystatin domain-containing protein n=1 Tax=Schistocephalus solidus TaxID=70667 RepID=A0A183TA32_SCHSO|nr:unnamed protein product [Schistocephalus solidus]
MTSAVTTAVIFWLTLLIDLTNAHNDEMLTAKGAQLLGGVQQLTENALNSQPMKSMIHKALQSLAKDKGDSCSEYKHIRTLRGTRQVVNGILYKFVVEVEAVPTANCMSAPSTLPKLPTRETYEITHLDRGSATADAEPHFDFEKVDL